MNIAAHNRRPLIVLAALALLSGATFTPALAADRGAVVEDDSAYYPKDPEVECNNPEGCGDTYPGRPCLFFDGDCVTGPDGNHCERNRQECVNWYCDRNPEKCGEKPTPRPDCRFYEDPNCDANADPVSSYERRRGDEE